MTLDKETLKRHRAQVFRNLAELDERYKAGKITRAEYLQIRRDGHQAEMELRQEAGE